MKIKYYIRSSFSFKFELIPASHILKAYLKYSDLNIKNVCIIPVPPFTDLSQDTRIRGLVLLPLCESPDEYADKFTQIKGV